MLAVPGGDDGARRDVRVVAVPDAPAGFGQGGTGGQQGPVRAVERERASGGGGDEVAAVVDQVVVRAQTDEVVQAGPAAIAPVLDVAQVGLKSV